MAAYVIGISGKQSSLLIIFAPAVPVNGRQGGGEGVRR